MNTLTFTASADLSHPTFPVAKTDYGSRVVKIALMKDSDTITVAGTDAPTAAEFQTAITSGDVVIIEGITNGHRVAVSATELSGDDTETAGLEKFDRIMSVEGRVKRFDETVLRALELYDKHDVLRAWFFTEKNYCFGGIYGYKTSPVFDPLVLEGVGTQPYVTFSLQYFHTGKDTAKYDADYDALDNS
jgi:hypothetical protein